MQSVVRILAATFLVPSLNRAGGNNGSGGVSSSSSRTSRHQLRRSANIADQCVEQTVIGGGALCHEGPEVLATFGARGRLRQVESDQGAVVNGGGLLQHGLTDGTLAALGLQRLLGGSGFSGGFKPSFAVSFRGGQPSGALGPKPGAWG